MVYMAHKHRSLTILSNQSPRVRGSLRPGLGRTQDGHGGVTRWHPGALEKNLPFCKNSPWKMAMLLPGDLKGSHPKSPAGHRTAQSPERGPRVTSVVLGSENDVSHSIGTQGSPESQTSVLRSGRFSWPYRPSLSSTFSVEPWDFDVVLVAQSCPNTWSGLPFPSPSKNE